MDVEQIMREGVIFKKAKETPKEETPRIKTKAKKTSYVKGTHGSGAAKMKANYKKKTQMRNKAR